MKDNVEKIDEKKNVVRFVLQSIPEELGDSHNGGEPEGTAFLPVQPSTSEGELKLHLSDDEDEDEDEEEEFDNDYEKTPEDDAEAEEEGQFPEEQDEPQQEVDEDQEQIPGEEAGEQEAECDIGLSTPVPEQEDPEAVALKKRT